MALVNHATKEITAKLVYYGPGLSGKTTNLEWIHKNTPLQGKGEMSSLSTVTERTLFFDFLPVEVGKILGYEAKVQIYTVPGQVFYEATRRMVLKGADAVVFVVDSQKSVLQSNRESQQDLRRNLMVHDLDPRLPIVLQYNKRDLPDALSVEALNKELNPSGLTAHEAVAIRGIGVDETLKSALKELFSFLNRLQRFSKKGEAGPRVTGKVKVEPLGTRSMGKVKIAPSGTRSMGKVKVVPSGTRSMGKVKVVPPTASPTPEAQVKPPTPAPKPKVEAKAPQPPKAEVKPPAPAPEPKVVTKPGPPTPAEVKPPPQAPKPRVEAKAAPPPKAEVKSPTRAPPPKAEAKPPAPAPEPKVVAKPAPPPKAEVKPPTPAPPPKAEVKPPTPAPEPKVVAKPPPPPRVAKDPGAELPVDGLPAGKAWQYLDGDRPSGPFDLDDLIDMVLARKISEDVPVRSASQPEWTPASRVSVIAEEIPPPLSGTDEATPAEGLPDFATVPKMLRSVLIADEDPAFRKFLALPLRAQHFKVYEATGGDDAWMTVLKERPWLILADVNLPVMPGSELCRRVRGHSLVSRTPVLFVSREDDYETRHQGLQAGADDFLSKRTPIRELLVRIQLLLTRYSELNAGGGAAGADESDEGGNAMEGELDVLGCPAVIQMCNQGSLTGILTAQHERGRGSDGPPLVAVFGFRQGQIISATAGVEEGPEAVYEFLAWTHGHFVFTPGDPGEGEPIARGVEGLLLEGCRRLDEARRDTGSSDSGLGDDTANGSFESSSQ